MIISSATAAVAMNIVSVVFIAGAAVAPRPCRCRRPVFGYLVVHLLRLLLLLIIPFHIIHLMCRRVFCV